jgi:DNA-binding HxlR family transcriptional regulator
MDEQRGERIHTCGVEATLDVIGGKWMILILCRLQDGTRRFAELRRLIPGITEKMLIQQLRRLESDGIVRRTVYPEIPPRVEYSLTAKGETLLPVLDMLERWGEEHSGLMAPRAERATA